MREHEVFDGAVEWDIVLKEGLCLNRNAPKIERKYFIKWTETNAGDYEYRASYIVGAQWVDTQTQQHIPVIVEPKMDGIDFMKMFMTCFFSNLETDRFSKIYNIDFDAEPIRSNTLENILSPMIIFHFVAIVKKLLANPCYPAPEFVMNPDVKDFYKFTVDDFALKDYKYTPFTDKLEVAV